MVRQLRAITLTAVVLMAVAVAASAQEGAGNRWIDGGHGERVLSISRYQVGFGIGYRIDDSKYHTYTPTFQGRFFRYFIREVALVGTVEYNNYSKLSSRTSFSTAGFGAGVRLEPPKKTVMPMVEVGLWFPYYWGTSHGRDLHDWQPGLRLGAGYSFGIGSGMSIDLTLSQVINHIRTPEYTVSSPVDVAPCPPGVDCDYYHGPPDEVYNTTSVEASLRFGL